MAVASRSWAWAWAWAALLCCCFLTLVTVAAAKVKPAAGSKTHPLPVEIARLQRNPAQKLLEGADYAGAAKFSERHCAAGDRVCDASNKFLRQLFERQYPKDCNSPDVKYLLCYPLRKQGFGSTFHHMLWCLTLAVASGRTAVFVSQPNIFNKAPDCPDAALRGTWECYFQPVSSCPEPNDDRSKRVAWKEGVTESHSARVLYMNMIWGLDDYKYWAPQHVREWLAGTPVKPEIWLKGQLAWFLTRLHPRMGTFVEETKKKIGFKHPIVGIHVRRTDKVSGKSKEANAVELADYMAAIDRHFNLPPLHTSPTLPRSLLKSKSTPALAMDPGPGPIASSPAQTRSPEPPAGNQHRDGAQRRDRRRRRRKIDLDALLQAHGAGRPESEVLTLGGTQSLSPSLLEAAERDQPGTEEKPRVFVSTDEPEVMEQARRTWGERYEIVVHEDGIRADRQEKDRYRYEGMRQMLADVVLLGECEYFVGTFSSNLSRWVYELLHYYRNGDAATSATSLDKEWYYEF